MELYSQLEIESVNETQKQEHISFLSQHRNFFGRFFNSPTKSIELFKILEQNKLSFSNNLHQKSELLSPGSNNTLAGALDKNAGLASVNEDRIISAETLHKTNEPISANIPKQTFTPTQTPIFTFYQMLKKEKDKMDVIFDRLCKTR